MGVAQIIWLPLPLRQDQTSLNLFRQDDQHFQGTGTGYCGAVPGVPGEDWTGTHSCHEQLTGSPRDQTSLNLFRQDDQHFQGTGTGYCGAVPGVPGEDWVGTHSCHEQLTGSPRGPYPGSRAQGGSPHRGRWCCRPRPRSRRWWGPHPGPRVACGGPQSRDLGRLFDLEQTLLKIVTQNP